MVVGGKERVEVSLGDVALGARECVPATRVNYNRTKPTKTIV